MYIHAEVLRRARRKRRYNHSGDYGRKVPPVPIPNTEVKLNCAESTLLATAREDKELPHSIYKERSKKGRSFCLLYFRFLLKNLQKE